MNSYGIDDIETLSFRDGVRKRIQMYLGSADMQGVYSAIQEIISNSIDEYYMGFGNKIQINLENLERGQLITICDWGRGIPFGIREDGTNVLVDIFSKAHTGGKFNEKVYQSVAGLNGIGAKATCLSSLEFSVKSVQNGILATAIFEKGNLISYKEEKANPNKGRPSTEIHFILDPEVYKDEPIFIDIEVLKKKCKNLSYLTKGLHFIIGDERDRVEYFTNNGLIDLIKDNVKNPVHKTPIYTEYEEDDNKIEIAMQWTKEKEKSFVFTNGLENIEGGTPLTGIKTAITRYIKKTIGDDFNGDMARTGLVYAVSCRVKNPSFANQTKTKINNPELNGLAQRTTGKILEQFRKAKEDEFKQIVDFLSKEKRAEAAAEKARHAVLNATREINEGRKKKVLNIDKLSDCEVLGQNSVLLLVEGDSAAGAMARARDTKKYGILSLRGKVINALSNPLEDIFDNEEVKLFLQATGIDFNRYDSKKLRYGKVAICVDADKR